MTVVDDIKARIDIVELVGESVSLRKSGRTFKAPCPFHTERTPSFIVDPGRQTWHCFGACSEGGDVFSWVMKKESVEFREALRILADRSGVRLAPLDVHAEERKKRLERLHSANETAAAFFHDRLKNAADAAEARDYVKKRGLNDEVIDVFQIGHAADEREVLLGYLMAQGFSSDEVVAAGLASETDHGPVDRFRGRLVFPIRDSRGRSVGIGGRTLTGNGAKYLNTPQTAVFDKSGLLYGLDHAREAVREADQVIIVEGYMDVLAAHQHGQKNVVASMGTALTEKQVALIKPITRNFLLALDADAAGIAATQRGIETTRESVGTEKVPVLDARGLVRIQDELAADIRIIDLPADRDPDDLIRLDPERWSALVKDAPNYLDYRFASAKTAHDPNDARQRAAMMEDLLPLVAAITQPVVKAEYMDRLASMVRVDVGTLRSRMRGAPAYSRSRPRGSQSSEGSRSDVIGRAVRPKTDSQAEFLLKLLIARPEVIAEIDADTITLVQDGAARELLVTCLDAEDGQAWRAAVPTLLEDYLTALEASARELPPFSAQQASEAVRQTIKRMRERRLRAELHAQREAIAEHERELGTLNLHQAVYDLGTKHVDPEVVGATAPAAEVLKNQAIGLELHTHSGAAQSEGDTPA